MGILKGAALGFFGFLLFLALIIFMVANTINGTVLSPDFITAEVDKIEIGPRVVDFAGDELVSDDFPPAARDALFSAIIATEPVIKQALNAGINSIADYLRGETDDPALSGMLSNTFFNARFLQTVLAEVDVATLASATIEDVIPGDYSEAILGAITENDERIKAQLTAASQPVFDYLLSQTSTIDLMSILRETVLTTDFVLPLLDELDVVSIVSSLIEEDVRDALPDALEFLAAGLDEALGLFEEDIRNILASNIDQILDYITGTSSTIRVELSLAQLLDFIPGLGAYIPESFTIDETMIGSDLPDQIRDGVTEAETTLGELRADIATAIADFETGTEDPRTWIGWFLDGYIGLIALLAVVLLAIVGIHREVKGATRQLGITALVGGIVGVVTVFIGDNFFTAQMNVLDIPLAMDDLPEILFNDVLSPFRTLSYGLVGGGLVLIAVSLIYPRLRARDTAEVAAAGSEPPVEPESPAQPEPLTEEPEPLAEEPEPPAEEPKPSA